MVLTVPPLSVGDEQTPDALSVAGDVQERILG
jgi:hypothetical protein